MGSASHYTYDVMVSLTVWMELMRLAAVSLFAISILMVKYFGSFVPFASHVRDHIKHETNVFLIICITYSVQCI